MSSLTMFAFWPKRAFTISPANVRFLGGNNTPRVDDVGLKYWQAFGFIRTSSMEADDDSVDFCCHRCSCWCVLRSTASNSAGSLVCSDHGRQQYRVLGLPI